jgi:hypothetical protein
MKAFLTGEVVARNLGDRLTKPLAKELGLEVSKATGIPIDRMAKRYLSAMICWFCEHYQSTQTILLSARQNTILEISDGDLEELLDEGEF